MRSLLLKSVIAFIVLNAAVGVVALLTSGGDFDDFELKVLFTTLGLSAAALVMLPATLILTSPDFEGLGLTQYATILAAVAGFGMLVAGIWTEPDGGDYVKTVATLVIVSLALGHSCLLSLAKLQPSLAWVRVVATTLAAVLAAEFIAGIWNGGIDGDLGRLVAITSILTLATSLLVPVLQFTSKPLTRLASDSQAAFCPRCGATLGVVSSRDTTCPTCRASFRVMFSDG